MMTSITRESDTERHRQTDSDGVGVGEWREKEKRKKELHFTRFVTCFIKLGSFLHAALTHSKLALFNIYS